MEYILHLLILISIYTMLSQSLNLSAGFGGMISLAHAGFYGVGAYTAAILSVRYSMPFFAHAAGSHVAKWSIGTGCIVYRLADCRRLFYYMYTWHSGYCFFDYEQLDVAY